MAELLRPDLCIVGAGALGVALAQHARRLGAEVVLVDRGVPERSDRRGRAIRLAALQTSAARAHAIRTGAAVGLANADPKPSLKAIQDRARLLATEHGVVDSTPRLSALGIQTLTSETRFTDPSTLAVGETQLRPRATILATGGVPVVPEIPGLDDAGYFTPEGMLDNTRKLTHLLVIGGHPDALALGQSFARFGSQVTVVPQGPLLPGYDVESVAILLRLLAEEGLQVIEGGAVRAIQPRSQGIGATVDTPDGERALDVSHILVAMGDAADVAGLSLDVARVRHGAGGMATGALGETSNRRIRVVGVAAGIEQWPHALAHGQAVVEAALTGSAASRPSLPARLVPTDPPLAEIGKPIGSGKAGGLYRMSFAENDLAVASGHGQGTVKIETRADGQIAGASIIGPLAPELASVLSLAMHRGLPLEALAELPVPHPSLFSLLQTIAVNRLADKPVSSWTMRRRALRRMMPF